MRLKLIASLTDLRKAPLVEEEYHGPVLLSSDAGADTLLSLLASGCHGHAAQAGHRGAHQRAVSPPAIMRACCRSFSMWSTIPA